MTVKTLPVRLLLTLLPAAARVELGVIVPAVKPVGTVRLNCRLVMEALLGLKTMLTVTVVPGRPERSEASKVGAVAGGVTPGALTTMPAKPVMPEAEAVMTVVRVVVLVFLPVARPEASIVAAVALLEAHVRATPDMVAPNWFLTVAVNC
ncbi:MAG: hypothetical protein AABZ01_12250, partial [Gemmatimonadota bacterium]